MPTLHKTPFGHVTQIWGSALIRGADGRMHVLKAGDAVHSGDVILTSQNGIVQMTDERGDSKLATLLPPDDANRVIAQLNSDDPDAATAAGLAGGDGGLQPGLRVDRISEGVTGAGFLSESGLDGHPLGFIGVPVGTTTSTAPPVSEPPETNPVNQPPQATPGHTSGNEDTRIPIALTGSDSDGTVVGVTVTSIPSGSSLLLGDGGTVVTVGQTLTPAQAANLLIEPPHDFNGSLQIGFTVSDDQGAVSLPAQVQIGVIPVNDAPAAHPDAARTPADTPVTIDVLANDTDPDGDALHVQSASVDPALGTVVVNGDGSITFTPVPNVSGPVAIDYVVADPTGATSQSTATVTVEMPPPVDHPPVISSDSASITENDPPIGGLLTASDADNAALAFVPGASNGAWGVLTLDAAGHWSYALAPASEALAQGQVVVEHFTVGLNDGSTTSVTITVTGTADAPVVTGEQGGTVTEDATLVASGQIGVADADAGQSGTQAASLAGTYGDLAIDAAGHWSYTLRNADANVQALRQGEQVHDDFTVLATDGTPITVAISVNGANETPLAQALDASGSEGAAIPVTLGGSDIDGTIASFTLTALPEHGTLMIGGSALGVGSVVPASGGTATLVFVPDALWNGSTSLSFSTTDNDGGTSAPVTQAIVVTPVNDAPLAVDDSASTSENTSVTFAVLGNDSDPDGDALVVTGAHIASGNGSVSVNADNTLSYDPGTAYDFLAPGATASVQIGYAISDGHGGTANAIATVTITGTNDGPLARPDANATSEDGPPAVGNVISDAPGQDSDIDGGALLVTGVAAGNAAPLGGVGASIGGAWGSVVIDADGHYSYTPGAAAQALAAGQNVSDTFSYAISDGQGGSASSTLTITVLGADDAPSFGGTLTGDVTEDGVLVATGAIVVVDADAGQSGLQPQAGTVGSYGSFSIDADGHWSYTLNNPAAHVQGLADGQVVTDSFSVTSSDGSTRSVVVVVHGTDDAPVALIDVGSTQEDVAIHGNVLDNDSDIDGGALAVTQFVVGGITYLAGSTAAIAGVGLLQIDADGGYGFMPALDYNGPVPVATYTVSDGILTSTSTLSLDVTPANDPPLALDDALTTLEDQPLTIAPATLLGNDHDVDGDALSISSVQGAVHGTVALVAGNIVFTPDADYNGPASFSYSIGDGHGGSSTATVHIGVLPVNDAPLGVNDVASTPEDTLLAGNVLANDSDIDGPSLVVTQFSVDGAIYPAGGTAALPGIGTLLIAANGDYTFTPAPDYSGPVPVASYTLSDGQYSSAATLAITVTPVNDVPTTQADICGTDEGTNGWLPGHVLANDSDPEGEPLHVSYVASSALAAAVAVNGINTITTALGGTVIMEASGAYRYIAPARDHADGTPDIDSFVYRASDGHGDSAWTTVQINIVDTAPTAVADAAAVAFGGSVAGNLLFNDLSVDTPRTLTSVSFGGVEHAVAASGTTTIDTPDGLLSVAADGSYTYTSQLPPVMVLTGGTLAQWEQTTDLYGFPSGTAWQSGSSLNLAALDATAANNTTFVSSGKPGIGVAGGGSSLGSGEQLIVHLHETAVHATLGIAQLNANQGLGNAHWATYAADGQLVASGDFAGAPLNNGNEYTIDIDTGGQAFSYLRFSWGSNSQGFVLSSLETERMPGNHTESFGYTMSDADGDLSSSTLTVTPGTSSGTQSATLDGTAGGDYLFGDARDNTINGFDNNDQLFGNAGNDTINGGGGHDLLNGGAGNDALDGGSGRDILIGGAGNDALTGGSGADVFAWNFADRGAPGAPAIDTVADLDIAHATNQLDGGDVLDLRDLLQGEQTATSLDHYLQFDTTSQPGSTLIHVSSSGGFAEGAGWSAAQAGSQDQTIVLQGIADIRGALSLDAAASDNQVIQALINQSKLLVDHGP